MRLARIPRRLERSIRHGLLTVAALGCGPATAAAQPPQARVVTLDTASVRALIEALPDSQRFLWQRAWDSMPASQRPSFSSPTQPKWRRTPAVIPRGRPDTTAPAIPAAALAGVRTWSPAQAGRFSPQLRNYNGLFRVASIGPDSILGRTLAGGAPLEIRYKVPDTTRLAGGVGPGDSLRLRLIEGAVPFSASRQVYLYRSPVADPSKLLMVYVSIGSSRPFGPENRIAGLPFSIVQRAPSRNVFIDFAGDTLTLEPRQVRSLPGHAGIKFLLLASDMPLAQRDGDPYHVTLMAWAVGPPTMP